MTVSPLVDGLVLLTLLFLPFWLMWRATQWVCPPAASLTAWFVGQLRQILRYLARWLHRQLWQRPAAQYGTAVALWLVLAVAVVFCAVALLVSGEFGSVLGLLPWAATLAGYWYLLRWWRTRLYRPRPLPRRRRPRNG